MRSTGSARSTGEKLHADAVQPRHEAVDDDRDRDGSEDEGAQDRAEAFADMGARLRDPWSRAAAPTPRRSTDRRLLGPERGGSPAEPGRSATCRSMLVPGPPVTDRVTRAAGGSSPVCARRAP